MSEPRSLRSASLRTQKEYARRINAALDDIDRNIDDDIPLDKLAAVAAVKKKAKFSRFPEVRFEKFAEGKAAQIMHIGPYAAEGPTIERLRQFIAGQGYQLRGRHHEIYFGDPRRAEPEKLKTIIRQPAEPA